MSPFTVRVSHVMNLESKGVLQVVARLLGLKPRHHGRTLVDVDDHQTTRLGQGAGDLPYLVG